MNTITQTAVERFEEACESIEGVRLDLVTAEQIDSLKNLAGLAEVENILLSLAGWTTESYIDKAPYISSAYEVAHNNAGSNVVFDSTTATWIVLEELKLIYSEAVQMKSDEDNEILAQG